MPSKHKPARSEYGRIKLSLTAALLLVGQIVTLGGRFAARETGASLMGWRFSVWVGAQGVLVACCLTVWLYARSMA